MNTPSTEHEPFNLEAAFTTHRAYLVRMCAFFTGDADVAEDLVQETFIEAWRCRHTLRDPAAHQAWLTGIARNVCRRWQRQQFRHRQVLADDPHAVDVLPHMGATNVDLDVELERNELATLLDRALALLPPATRAVLIETFVEESPHADIATRLGMSENAVAVRVHRGKIAFRRILATTLRDDAAAYGLVGTNADPLWQETRIWCPKCGQRRLHGHFDPAYGEFALRCTACCPEPNAYIARATMPDVFAGVNGYKAALNRMSTWANQYFRHALAHHMAPCTRCARPTALHLALPMDVPPSIGRRGIYLRCTSCDAVTYTAFSGLSMDLPAAQQFWRAHQRVRTLPERTVEVHGRLGLLVRIESMVNGAYLDTVSAADTYEVVHSEEGRHA